MSTFAVRVVTVTSENVVVLSKSFLDEISIIGSNLGPLSSDVIILLKILASDPLIFPASDLLIVPSPLLISITTLNFS